MVVSGEKERVRTLLRDTITLLIRNGLAFKSKFSVEALIGVTLDDEDICLFSINELIKTDLCKQLEAQKELEAQKQKEAQKEQQSQKGKESQKASRSSDDYSEGSSNSGDEGTSERRGRRKRKKIPRVKNEPDAEDDQGSLLSDASSNAETKRPKPSDSSEHLDRAPKEERSLGSSPEHEDEDEDIVFIKEEIDTWSQSGANNQQSDYSFQSTNMAASGDMNFTSLADMNLVPVTSGDTTWQQGNTPAQYQRRLPIPATVTSQADVSQADVSQADMSQAGQPMTQQRRPCPTCGRMIQKRSWENHMNWHQGKYRYYCNVCGKGCWSTTQLRGHMVSHTGHKEYKCDFCGKEFAYRTHLYTHLRRSHPSQISHSLTDTALLPTSPAKTFSDP